MSLKTFVEDIFKKVESFFTSGEATKVAQEVATLAEQALPIVQDIASMTPNKTVQEVEAVAQKYGVAIGSIASENSAQIGNTLLNIATEVLQKNHAPTASVSLLNTAVQMAVLATNSAAKPATPPAA